MSKEICNPEYLAKAQLLKKDEKERLLSRMGGKLPRRLAKEKLTVDEALAIQLEIEDEQLAEWRERMHAIQAKEAAKGQKKKETAEGKALEQAKVAKPKAVKAAAPAKPPGKTAQPAKPAKSTASRPVVPATQAKAKTVATPKAAKKPAAAKPAAKSATK